MQTFKITDFNNENVNVAVLISALTSHDLFKRWIKEVDFIFNYVSECNPKAEPKQVVIRHKESGAYLRWSKGPIQGYFWDSYPDDFGCFEWAIVAISQAPIYRNCKPIEFKIPKLDNSAA